MAIRDRYQRPLQSLRISVTDRCNLRCQYCMPEEEYRWVPRDEILQFEEISVLVDCFLDLGVDKIRITGGDPLVRRDVAELVRMLRGKAGIVDIALTTNGVLLAEQAAALKAAGLDRVTISLDTLRPDRFKKIAGRDSHANVLEGLRTARGTGFVSLKINSVIILGLNDDEIVPLIEFAKQMKAEVRFIEYMDVGGATRWSIDQVVPRKEILRRLRRHYGSVEPVEGDSSAPAGRFRLPDGTTFGVIASVTEPFCRSCDRSRLTADGVWYPCLYATHGIDLRNMLRGGASSNVLRNAIARRWENRTDRGAEQRLATAERGPLFDLDRLRRDPHLEMHTRGG
ncbi:MAG TPA: GTP 3',8-cyclase MoaA [Bdellovibrionota bacterium]|nr:GTP 3',8-cyclase MoaA [Bdellovibrionota bacterium]